MKKYLFASIILLSLGVTSCKKESIDASEALSNSSRTSNPATTGRSGQNNIVDLGHLTDYGMVFTSGSVDANWQGATKGFVGDVAVDGITAHERTSGNVPFRGSIYTNDSQAGAWNAIANSNSGHSNIVLNQVNRISELKNDLDEAFTNVNAMTATTGFTAVSPSQLDNLNTQDGVARTYVINITSGFQVTSKIDITGDADDQFILRWDADADPSNGYQGLVKFQSGGAIVPHGDLSPSSFINVAGDISSSGGGSNPALPYPQGPRTNNGTGALIPGASNFSGGGFFTGYWLTTGDPDTGKTHSLSNAIFVGGWYSRTTQFSMTSGTSLVYVAPNSGS